MRRVRTRMLFALLLIMVGSFSVSLNAEENATDARPDVYRPMAPRWQFAPIARPYFIGWYGAPTPSRPGFDVAMLLETQTLETEAPREDLGWWYGRGILGFPWAAGTQVGWLNTKEDYVEQFMKAIRANQVGICLDEMVDFDAESQRLRASPETKKYPGNPKNRRLVDACRTIKRQSPTFFIAVYSHMQSDSMIEAIHEGWIDLNIIMFYMYWPDQPAWTEELALRRLNNAKRAGVLENTVPCIGIKNAPNQVVTLEWVEKWIRYYREHFPQMPGVVFYPHPYQSVKSADVPVERQGLVRHCDQLVKKYYVDPAPKITIESPRDGALVSGRTRIHAVADKTVAKWRLYVGAKQVAENDTGDFEIENLETGTHVLTIHAITADWLRGAAQTQISVVGE